MNTKRREIPSPAGGFCIGPGRFARPALGMVALLLATPAIAQTVYKSVDGQGNVTYSSEPPPDAVQVEVEPIKRTAPADAKRGKQELERVQGLADELEGDRKAREASARADDAANDEPTVVMEPEDRRTIVDRTRQDLNPTPMPLPAEGGGIGSAGIGGHGEAGAGGHGHAIGGGIGGHGGAGMGGHGHGGG